MIISTTGIHIVKIAFISLYIPGATAPFFAAGVVPLPAAGLGAGFAAALTGALAATGFLGGILKRNVKKKTSLKSSYILLLSICKHHRSALGDLKKETISLVKINTNELIISYINLFL